MKYLIVSDYPLVGKAIEHLIESSCPGMVYLGQVFMKEDCIGEIEDMNPDLIFIDIITRGDFEIETIKEILGEGRQWDVVLLDSEEDFHLLQTGLRLGISDYILKPFRAEDLLSSVSRIAEKREADAGRQMSDNTNPESEIRRRAFIESILAGDMVTAERCGEEYWEAIADGGGVPMEGLVKEMFVLTNELIYSYTLNSGDRMFDSRYDVLADELGSLLWSARLAETEEEIFDQIKKISVECTELFKKEEPDFAHKQIEQAKEIINKNLKEKITLEYVAKEVFLSPFYLSRLFKSCTGMKFSEYVVQQRINAAKKQLLTTNESIETISLSVGYSEPNSFRRLFKKKTGVSPSTFRRNQKDTQNEAGASQ